MNTEEIQKALKDAIEQRVPRIDPNIPMRQRIEAMENYMVETAYHRGQLEEAFYWTDEAYKVLKREWDDIQGWEPFLSKQQRSGSGPTQDAIRLAKKNINRDLHDSIQESKRIMEALGRQIRRLEFDYNTLSRVYTLMTGS